MSDIIPLDDINPTGINEHPPDASVKLHGPPGTGKTTQSAARVGRLLRDYDYSIEDVAWCTYRKALAKDTLGRFAAWDLVDETELENPNKGATRYIATIHAVANRTVGDLPEPVQPGHKIDFCNRMDMRYLSQDPWDDTPGKLLFRTFAWMKNNRLDPADPGDVHECPVADDLREHWNGSVPAVWNKWTDYKAQKDIIDFYEMLEAPLKERATPTDQILVIDEYHDATPLMAELCEYWIEHADTVIVAGDPNQVVNAFDGADPGFFTRLDLPKVLLDRTYRVPEEHWQAATQLLKKAHEVPPVTREGHGKIIEYRSPQFAYSDESGWQTPAPHAEAGPAKVVTEHGHDTLFLTRMQMQADGIGHALEKAGVIYNSQADLHGWNTDNGELRLALFNALQKIEGFKPGHFGRGGGLSRYGEMPANPEAVTLQTAEATALLNHVHASCLAETRSETDDLVDDIEQRERTPTLEQVDDWVATEFWHRYSEGSASVSRLNKGNLSDRDRVALTQALKRYDAPKQPDDVATAVLTIHASKGQEAEDVVVYDGISRRIRREMAQSPRAEYNEWRTWYVALTRASKRLHIMRNAFDWAPSIIPTDVRKIAGGTASD